MMTKDRVKAFLPASNTVGPILVADLLLSALVRSTLAMRWTGSRERSIMKPCFPPLQV